MAVTPKKGKPTISVTYLAGILSGLNQCVWQSWLKSHFKYEKLKSDFDFEAWAADHDALVSKRIREFRTDGAKVRVEGENWVRLAGETATLIGKPDVIAERGAQFTIADGKTGEPSKRDWHQMTFYLYIVPKAWGNPNLRMTGEVFYKNGSRVDVHPEEFTTERRKEAFELVRLLASPTPPPKTPTIQGCAMCDILDCDKRIKDVPEPVATDDF